MDHDDGELDGALVGRAQLGDTEAFDALIARHLSDLHDHLARVVADPHTELTVEVLDAVLARLGALRNGRRFRIWLYRLAGEFLDGAQRVNASHPPAGITPEQRNVWREADRLPLAQVRTLDLVVRRGLSIDEVREVVRGNPERHLRRALRRLDDLTPDGWAVFDSLPAHPAPAPAAVAPRIRRRWSLAPGPPPPPTHHGLVVWGAAVAAVLLSMLVPALVGFFPIERQAAIAAVEYTAAPFMEASGVSEPVEEEPEAEVLPSLPAYELETEEPETEPEAPTPPPSTAPSPSPTPSPPAPSPSPEPTPTETATCGVLDILPPCESPSPEPSPQPSPEPTEQGT